MATIRGKHRHSKRRLLCFTFYFWKALLLFTIAILLPVSWFLSSSSSSSSSTGFQSTALINVKRLRGQSLDDDNVVTLSFQIDIESKPTVAIRLRLYSNKAPKASEYVKRFLNTQESCKKCTIYRGEPVPDYWGSEEYPDRYFDGGRYGPPYALVQGMYGTKTNYR